MIITGYSQSSCMCLNTMMQCNIGLDLLFSISTFEN